MHDIRVYPSSCRQLLFVVCVILSQQIPKWINPIQFRIETFYHGISRLLNSLKRPVSISFILMSEVMMMTMKTTSITITNIIITNPEVTLFQLVYNMIPEQPHIRLNGATISFSSACNYCCGTCYKNTTNIKNDNMKMCCLVCVWFSGTFDIDFLGTFFHSIPSADINVDFFSHLW